jgi:hypothetical protein
VSRATVIDNTDAVRKAVKRAAWKNLAHAAAGLRKAAQYSIKTRQTSSQAGTPPNTRKGALRRSILFAVENGVTAVIGPSVNLISDVARAHEHGGPQRPRSTRGVSESEAIIAGTNWKLELGGHGPIPDFYGDTAYIKFVSSAQIDKSLRYIYTAPPEAFGNTNKLRTSAERRQIRARIAASGGVADYPARPFMGPALMNNLDRLPALWSNSVR